MPRAVLQVLALVIITASACSRIPNDPLRLDHGLLTVENQTSDDWKDVEIWINRYFRVTVPSIVAGSIFQVRLDSFVSGYAQRFDVQRIPVNDLRLTAKRLTGEPIQLKLEPRRSGLAALGGKT